MRKFLLFSLMLLTVMSVQAQDKKREIEVEGKATLCETPEKVTVNIPVSAKDATYKSCSDRLLKDLNELQKAFTKAGIKKDDIKTDNLHIREATKWDAQTRKNIPDGYRGDIQIKVIQTYSDDVLDKIIKIAQEKELTFSLRFELSEKQKEELTKKAIKEAVGDAKSKAEILTSAAGVKLSYIKKIEYEKKGSSFDPLGRTYLASERTSDASGSGVSLNPQEMVIEKHVTITWAIE